MTRCLAPTIVLGALTLCASAARALPPVHMSDDAPPVPADSAADAPAPGADAPLSEAELL